jgi:tripartite-type tricarboxylate transporter receptor subunit TctC
VIEFARNDDDRRVLRLLTSETEIGRSFYSGPKVPAERVAMLRKAFMAMVEDKSFIAEAAKRGASLDPMSGEEIQKMIRELSSFSSETFARARDITAP